jgi:cellulose synthase operon protein C
LNPDDAAAWARLGSIYRQLQQYDDALAAYRQAVALDERAFPIFFELAELYLGLDRPADADELYRVIMAEATEESQILRAGRRSIRISQALGTLDELFGLIEPELYADQLSDTYLKLLVEVIDAAALPLLQATRRGTAEERAASRASLDDYGRRTLRPLLDAMAGDDVLVKRKALEVLAMLGNANATVAMIRVLDDPDDTLHEIAALAVARMADERATEPLQRVIGTNTAWRSALIWALGRTGSAEAVPTLTEIALRSSAGVQQRAFAAAGLMRLPAQDVTESTVRRLLGDVSSEMQAAGALLAAVHGVRDVLPDLQTVVAYGSPGAAAAAALAIGVLSNGPEDRAVLGAAYYAGDAQLRTTAARALLLQGQGALIVEELQALDQEPVLQGWLRSAEDPGAVVEWLVTSVTSTVRPSTNLDQLLDETFVPALRVALQSDPDRQRAAIVDLVDDAGRPTLARLSSALTDEGRRALGSSVAVLIQANRGQLISLAQSPRADVAAASIRALAGLAATDAEVLAVVVAALASPVDGIQIAAMRALPAGSASQTNDALLRAASHESWDVRSAAAAAMGRVGATSPDALETLRAMAATDASRQVRHVATQSLFLLSPESTWPELRQSWPTLDRPLRVMLASTSPPDPQVRSELAALAVGDIDVMVRQAAVHLEP